MRRRRFALLLVVSLLVVAGLAAASVVAVNTLRDDRPAAPRPSATAASPVAGATTRWGAAPGGSPQDYLPNLARVDESLGRLGAVRVYYSGPPDAWPGKAPGRDVVVSFKMPPTRVLAGEFDDRMRQWFANAPTDLTTYWVYQHEPENDIEVDKAFTAADFRAAFSRLSALAREARNPRLKATVVLMQYTLTPAAGRDWRNYYPGDDVVDVFAWDAYSRPRRAGQAGYESPEELFGAAYEISNSRGKPFAVAEFGSELAEGDTGAGRAAWLRSVGQWVKEHPTEFMLYFNVDFRVKQRDYRLLDEPSRQAWREISGS